MFGTNLADGRIKVDYGTGPLPGQTEVKVLFMAYEKYY